MSRCLICYDCQRYVIIDLQLREGDRLMYYHGTTAILTVLFNHSTNCLRYSASEAYSEATGFQELM